MTLPYLQPLFRPRAVIAVNVFLMLTACATQPPISSEAVPVVNDQVVDRSLIPTSELSLTTPSELSLTTPSELTLTTPSNIKPVVPVVSVANKTTPVAVQSSNKPTDSIAFWLGEAGWAFEQDKLTTPTGESAYYYLTRVLTKEPRNPQALAALEKIVQRYYELLQASLTNGKVQQARVFLSRAKKVMPKHGQLTTMRKLIESHAVKPQVAVGGGPETAVPVMRNQKLLLPTTLIDQQDDRLAQWLVVVAQKAQNLQATMLIVAPKDVQARWVYQTMNSADPEQRIRANIKHSQRARLEVNYLARKDELQAYSN